MQNGLWVVAEQIPTAQSLAMSLLVPAGYAVESPGQQGVATMLGELLWRCAGKRNAKAHCDALDNLGVDRGAGVEMYHISLYAMMIGSKISDALPLLVDAVRRPTLPSAAIEPCRDLAIQDLQ